MTPNHRRHAKRICWKIPKFEEARTKTIPWRNRTGHGRNRRFSRGTSYHRIWIYSNSQIRLQTYHLRSQVWKLGYMVHPIFTTSQRHPAAIQRFRCSPTTFWVIPIRCFCPTLTEKNSQIWVYLQRLRPERLHRSWDPSRTRDRGLSPSCRIIRPWHRFINYWSEFWHEVLSVYWWSSANSSSRRGCTVSDCCWWRWRNFIKTSCRLFSGDHPIVPVTHTPRL